MVHRPSELNAFEFAVVSGLRARQLALGCTPRVLSADKITVTAQLEVAAGKVIREPGVPWTEPPQAGAPSPAPRRHRATAAVAEAV